MEQHKSLTGFLESLIKEAHESYSAAVDAGNVNENDWIHFYASFMSGRLAPYLSVVQGVSFLVDGKALPPFYTRQTQAELGEAYGRYHVG